MGMGLFERICSTIKAKEKKQNQVFVDVFIQWFSIKKQGTDYD